MSREQLKIFGVMCEIGAVCIFIAVHLLDTIFDFSDEVRWFIMLNNTRQVIFLDTLFVIGLVLMFTDLLIRQELMIYGHS